MGLCRVADYEEKNKESEMVPRFAANNVLAAKP